MCELGAVAYTRDEVKLGEFDERLAELPGVPRNKRCMQEFWLDPANAASFERVTTLNVRPPGDVMLAFKAWVAEMTLLAKQHENKPVSSTDGGGGAGDARKRRKVRVKPVMVAWPSAYDSMFVFWYYRHFVGEKPPWAFRAVDIKSLLVGALGVQYSAIHKPMLTQLGLWPADAPHTHRGVEDAEEQMQGFFLARNYSRRLSR
jgi:hypothetical protein